jgi:phosphatidylserine/phosphatidylglycerophosphate/cardiolipin synthase-like enzyme
MAPLRLILLSCFLLAAARAALADELQYLDHSELALARLYDDISQAQETIDLTYWSWDPCSSASKVLVKKLAEKIRPKPTTENPAPKPVKVRMLLDAYFDIPNNGAIQSYFRAQGIDMKFFNPGVGNYRTHTKMTLIDKAVPGKSRLITGGRNIGDEYFGMAKHSYVDRDVAVAGPSSTEDRRGTMAQAQKGFDKLWASYLSTKLSSRGDAESREHIAACTKWTAKDHKLEKYLQARGKRAIEKEKKISCANVKFTADDVGHADVKGTDPEHGNSPVPAFKSEQLAHKPTTLAVLDFLRGAEDRLVMENQFYIPDDPFKGILRAKRRENVKIDVYSNMFEEPGEIVAYWHTKYMRSDHKGSQTNHSNFRVAGLLDKWEFTPPGAKYSYHSKVFTADGKDAIVSSFNIDPRSVSINGESALVVKNCPLFAQKVEQVTKLTGRVWTLEENLALCQGQERPTPALPTGVDRLIQFITRDFQ